MFKLKSYHYFWITCVVFAILWMYWSNSEAAIDINIYDTYYVIANTHIALLLFIAYGFMGLIYWSFYRAKMVLIKPLTKLHTFILIGGVIVYFFGITLIDVFRPKNNFPLFDKSNFIIYFMLTLFTFVIIGQLAFIINIFLSTFKNTKQKK